MKRGEMALSLRLCYAWRSPWLAGLGCWCSTSEDRTGRGAVLELICLFACFTIYVSCNLKFSHFTRVCRFLVSFFFFCLIWRWWVINKQDDLVKVLEREIVTTQWQGGKCENEYPYTDLCRHFAQKRHLRRRIREHTFGGLRSHARTHARTQMHSASGEIETSQAPILLRFVMTRDERSGQSRPHVYIRRENANLYACMYSPSTRPPPPRDSCEAIWEKVRIVEGGYVSKYREDGKIFLSLFLYANIGDCDNFAYEIDHD